MHFLVINLLLHLWSVSSLLNKGGQIILNFSRSCFKLIFLVLFLSIYRFITSLKVATFDTTSSCIVVDTTCCRLLVLTLIIVSDHIKSSKVVHSHYHLMFVHFFRLLSSSSSSIRLTRPPRRTRLTYYFTSLI